MPHFEGNFGHSLDNPAAHRGHLRAQMGDSSLRDVLCQVGAALQLGHYEQEAHQPPHFVTRGHEGVEVGPDPVAELARKLVKRLVSSHDPASLGRLAS